MKDLVYVTVIHESVNKEIIEYPLQFIFQFFFQCGQKCSINTGHTKQIPTGVQSSIFVLQKELSVSHTSVVSFVYMADISA